MSIFTRELGLVRATAQGIRLEKSKLRYSSQLYSFGIFSFVHGKEFWRLTSAGELLTAPPLLAGGALPRSSFHSSSGDSSHPSGGANNSISSAVPLGRDTVFRGGEAERGRAVPARSSTVIDLIARLALLLRRLLHGEEAHPELFDCVFECVKFLNINKLTEEQTQTLESLTVARTLHKLGYIGNDARLDGHLRSNDLTAQLLNELKNKRAMLNGHINKALKESHL